MSADISTSVRVLGIKELQGAFRAVDRELPNELKAEFLAIAQDIAGRVRADFPKRTGAAAGTVKAFGTRRGARIEEGFGSKDKDYVPWLDFGGTTGKGHKLGPGQGSVKREWMGKDVKTPAGRYIYPQVSAARDETARKVEEAVTKVATAQDFEVRG